MSDRYLINLRANEPTHTNTNTIEKTIYLLFGNGIGRYT